MNPVAKALWVADLRSGKPQSQMRLHDGVGHCCLGRLCEVAVRVGVIPPMWVTVGVGGESHYHYGHSGEHSTTTLPRAVRDWAGIDDEDPHIAPELTATQANDQLGWNFDGIADAIEEYL